MGELLGHHTALRAQLSNRAGDLSGRVRRRHRHRLGVARVDVLLMGSQEPQHRGPTDRRHRQRR
jgi:hypothetical protein